MRPSIVGILFVGLLALLPLLPLTQDIGPPPREVERPVEHKDRRWYTVAVYVDGKIVQRVGVDDWWDLDETLRTVAIRWAGSPLEWGQWQPAPGEDWIDLSKRPPRRSVEVSIWDHLRERWHHPGGKTMPDDWNGRLAVAVTVNCGSYRIE